MWEICRDGIDNTDEKQTGCSKVLASPSEALIYAPSRSREQCSPVAQLVEQATVNRFVASSSLAWGATLETRIH